VNKKKIYYMKSYRDLPLNIQKVFMVLKTIV